MVVAGTPRIRRTKAALLVGASTATVRRSLRFLPSWSPETTSTPAARSALVSCASVNFYAPCGDCQDEATCAIRRAFAILRDQSTEVLDSISLAEGASWEERLPNGNGV